MTDPLQGLSVAHDAIVERGDIARAVTAARLLYDDGATQTFADDGKTVYIDNGRPTHGQWYIDDSGRFCSYWPPSFRACYELRWVADGDRPIGLRFSEGSYVAVGRFQFPPS